MDKEEILEYVLSKIGISAEDLVAKLWWIGMTDRKTEGLNWKLRMKSLLTISVIFCVGVFYWSSGVPFDSHNAHINKWHHNEVFSDYASDNQGDCVVMDFDHDWDWFEENCTVRHSFVCMKSE